MLMYPFLVARLFVCTFLTHVQYSVYAPYLTGMLLVTWCMKFILSKCELSIFPMELCSVIKCLITSLAGSLSTVLVSSACSKVVAVSQYCMACDTEFH
jgi:hypothetical protein